MTLTYRLQLEDYQGKYNPSSLIEGGYLDLQSNGVLHTSLDRASQDLVALKNLGSSISTWNDYD